MLCMNNDFENTQHNEDLQAENEFLKMKLMLERGALFGSAEDKVLPPEIENTFLKNMIALEQQFDDQKTIRVFDKIGKPSHYKPANEISEEQIDIEWKKLSAYLSEYGIHLGVCSPNITSRELYRFTLEELFEYEMDDIDIEGLVHNFIYDEFHPDHIYENSTAATDECMAYILGKEPMEWMCHFRKQGIQLNQHKDLSEDDFKIIVNLYKQAYDDIEVNELEVTNCIVEKYESRVSGTYKVVAITGYDSCTISGNWQVFLEKDELLGYWYINNVQIEGLNL